MTDPLPVAAYDLPREAYPIQLRAYRTDNDKLVWEAILSDPPAVLRIPPLQKMLGVPVWIEMVDGTGRRTEVGRE